ncbi:MAG TPA: hypothetical protein ENK41_00130, partial [Rhodobacteraceae bacterium]|nr:hypothetical protein [Paracoccaceae bacterium]
MPAPIWPRCEAIRKQEDTVTPAWQVGIDIGGTFTDVVARGPDRGDVRAAKVATTPGDRAAGLAAALAAVGLGWGDIADLVLGTT